MTRRGKIAAGLLLLSALGTGGTVVWRTHQRAGAVRAARPAPPDLGAWPVELRERIAAASHDSVDALAELSRLYHANGFLAEAARCYVALEHLQRDEPRWLHRHANLLAGYGDAAPAISRWERVVALAPDYVPAQLQLADTLAKAERADAAARIYRGILERKSHEAHALLGLARLDLEANRWADALRRLEAASTHSGGELGADLLVAVYEHFGRVAEAAALRARAKAAGTYRAAPDPWMDELLEHSFDAYRLSLAAGSATRATQHAVAVRLLQRAVDLAPRDVGVRFQLAGALVAAGNPAQAVKHLEACTALSPEFPDAWAHLSALREQAGDRAGAEQALARGLQHCPQSPGLHLMRARQLRATGRATDAIAAYRASIRFRPNEADAYLELATTLFRLERVPEGLVELERALAAEPHHPMALALLALHAINERHEASARKWLGAVLRQPRVPREQADALRAGFREQFGKAF